MAKSKFLKWTGGGIRDVVLDCPMEAAWDLFSDWINWGRWYSLPDVVELLEGENRKPGCVRLVQFPDMWLHERILQIDNENHLLSFSIEGNDVLGAGIKGHVAAVKDAKYGFFVLSFKGEAYTLVCNAPRLYVINVLYIQFQETSEGKASVLYWKYELEPMENQTPEVFCSFADSILRNILTELERGAQKVAAGVDPKPVKPTPHTTEDSVLLETPAS